jgi:hypothetical protein
MSTTTPLYATKTAIAIAIASLASSSTFLAGRESDQVDNTSNRYADVFVQGKVRVGTSPTANTQILIYVWGSDTSLVTTALDVLDGADSAETITSAGVRNGLLRLIATLDVDAVTSDRDYYMAATALAQFFGGVMPKFWGLFVTHNTGVALNATGGNHVFEFVGVKPETV